MTTSKNTKKQLTIISNFSMFVKVSMIVMVKHLLITVLESITNY